MITYVIQHVIQCHVNTWMQAITHFTHSPISMLYRMLEIVMGFRLPLPIHIALSLPFIPEWLEQNTTCTSWKPGLMSYPAPLNTHWQHKDDWASGERRGAGEVEGDTLVLLLGVLADPGTYCFTTESESKLTSRHWNREYYIVIGYLHVSVVRS